MQSTQLTRLRNLADQSRTKSMPVAIGAQDFCDLVAESATEDPGLVRAAEALASCTVQVYVEAQTLVSLIDSLTPPTIPMPDVPADWSPPGSPEV